MKKRTKERRNQFDAQNAAKRIEAIADLVIHDQIPRRDGARRIYAEFQEFVEAIACGCVAGEVEASLVTYGLGVGLKASLIELQKKGPVMVRYIDGDALITLLMPDGPPPGGAGGGQ